MGFRLDTFLVLDLGFGVVSGIGRHWRGYSRLPAAFQRRLGVTGMDAVMRFRDGYIINQYNGKKKHEPFWQ